MLTETLGLCFPLHAGVKMELVREKAEAERYVRKPFLFRGTIVDETTEKFLSSLWLA